MRNADVWGPADTSWCSHQHTKLQQRAQLVSYWACSITPAPNISFYFFFIFCPHLPFVFIFLQSDKDNELEFSDGEKGIEGQGWKNENNMQKTYSLGLWEGRLPHSKPASQWRSTGIHMQCAPQWERGARLPAADHWVGSVNTQAN